MSSSIVSKRFQLQPSRLCNSYLMSSFPLKTILSGQVCTNYNLVQGGDEDAQTSSRYGSFASK